MLLSPPKEGDRRTVSHIPNSARFYSLQHFCSIIEASLGSLSVSLGLILAHGEGQAEAQSPPAPEESQDTSIQ